MESGLKTVPDHPWPEGTFARVKKYDDYPSGAEGQVVELFGYHPEMPADDPRRADDGYYPGAIYSWSSEHGCGDVAAAALDWVSAPGSDEPPTAKDILLEAGTAEPEGYDHVESYVDLENRTVEVSVRDRRTGVVYAYALKLVVGPVRSS